MALKIEGPKLDDPRFYTNQSAIDQVINENFKVVGEVAEGKGKDVPRGFILKSLQDVGLEKITENTGSVKKDKKDPKVAPLSGRKINKMYKDAVKNIKDAYDKLLIEINKEKRQSIKQNKRNAAKQKYLQDLSDAKSKYRQMFLDNNLKPSDYGL